MPTYKVYDRSPKGRLLGELRLHNKIRGVSHRVPLLFPAHSMFQSVSDTGSRRVVDFEVQSIREAVAESEIRRVVTEEDVLVTHAKMGELAQISEFIPEGDRELRNRYLRGGVY